MIARLIYVFALLASALLLGLGMYLQYAQHLQSCGPQVLVRYALMLAGLFALVALITGGGKIVRIAMSAGIALSRWPARWWLRISRGRIASLSTLAGSESTSTQWLALCLWPTLCRNSSPAPANARRRIGLWLGSRVRSGP